MTDRLRGAGQLCWAMLGLVAAVAVVGYVLWFIRVIWPPLLIAGAIMFLLNPVVTKLQHRHIPRAFGAMIAYASVAAVLGLAGFFIVPLAVNQAGELSEDWPDIRARGERWLDDRAEDSKGTAFEFTRDDLGDAFGTRLSFSEQVDRARKIGVQVLHVLLILVLGPIIGFYLLVDAPHLREVAESLIPERAKPEVFVLARRLSHAVGGFFRGQMMVALLVGFMCSAGLAAIGLRFWFLVGMIAGFFNIIPLVGPWIGGIPGVAIALTTASPVKAMLVVAVMAIAQQIDNHFITPQVMQRVVHLHPAAVMLALLAGGTLFGFFGLLLAVPAVAVMKILLSHVWRIHVLGEPLEELVVDQAIADSEPTSGVAAI